ncbi:hypothetical protein [Actinoallomurus rhizosphaericola]|uniref:hypothetical protein n=1 Tax=Actinoallomurus rhizosphaericola TaxID=2952536 RepID=UPI0020923BEA|nr:hypothetical protein [Actinoallomurus rhizosphaericola]MCO5996288.1 hypothetical protein [Actinoallomurus rhizosphaericola]
MALVAVEDGPRLVLQVGGSRRDTGRLVVAESTGRRHYDDAGTVSAELARRGSRIDTGLAAVAPDGAVLVPLSDPSGYHLVRFDR